MSKKSLNITISNHKYIITGVKGFIGSSIAASLSANKFIGLDRQLLNLRTPISDLTIPSHFNYDTLIHTAACAHIDKCENDKSNAWLDNVVATQNIIDFCKNNHKKLVFLSTECVFSGQKEAYLENDNREPINTYGYTKKVAEDLILRSNLDYLIIRSVVAYKKLDFGSNIVRSIVDQLRIGRLVKSVADQVVSFTYLDDIIKGIFTLVDLNANGIFHVAPKSAISPFELSLKICQRLGLDQKRVMPVSLQDFFGDKAQYRLKHAVLNSDKYVNFTKHKPLTVDEGLDVVVDDSRNR